MVPSARPTLVRYTAALASVLLAALLKKGLDPLLGREAPFLLFFGAVMVSAWYGGLRPGLVATVLSALIVSFFFPPAAEAIPPDANHPNPSLAFGVFLLEGSLISWLTDSLYSSRQQAEDLTRAREEALGREQNAHAVTRSTEQRYRDLVNSLEAVVWEADPDPLRFTFVSRPAEELLGYPVGQWLAEPDFWEKLIHPEDRREAIRLQQEAIAQKRDHSFEYRVTKSDGRILWVRNLMHVVRDQSGQPRQLRGLMLDITERKEAEDRKNQFLAMLSHELRNPLAPIRNALHIFRLSHLGNAVLADARDVMERQVQQLAGIVDDLLDVFQISHHQLVLRAEPLDLAALVRVTAGDHRASLESRGLALDLEAPDEPVWVRGDSVRLAQVLCNLLQNAAKFTNPTGRVTVRLTPSPKDGRATVAVQDTGIGMAPDMLAHLFETFAQGDDTLHRARGGLGLGLTLVKGLVELHGGGVRASSPGPGRGTEVAFWLPLAPRPQASAVCSSSAVPSIPPLRILIIEDNRDTAQTLARLLQHHGHAVTTAYTGKAGVAAARESRPDVILCDLGLPEMNGFEVAATLRQDPATTSARLIAVSGYGQEEDRQRCEQVGFDLHLIKPVDPVELQRLLAAMKVGA